MCQLKNLDNADHTPHKTIDKLNSRHYNLDRRDLSCTFVWSEKIQKCPFL